jgi:hypothetical protein
MIEDKTILYIGIILIVVSIIMHFSDSEKPKKEYGDEYEDEYEDDDDDDDVRDITESEVTKKTDDEETYVLGLIKELKNKPDKTQKDKDTIGLLEVKLNQLKNKK